MTLATQRRLIQAAMVISIACGVAALIWVLRPIPLPDGQREIGALGSTNNRQAGAGTGTDSDAPKPNQAANGPLEGYDLALRTPLYVPPKPPPKKIVKPEPPAPKPVRVAPPAWTLVGTIIEPGRRVAILSDQSGKTDIVASGDEVQLQPSGVTVTKITGESVTLDRQGSTSKVSLDRSFRGGQPEGKTPKRNGRGRNR